MSGRASLWIGFLAGGWAATLLMLLLPALGVRTAVAEDPPTPVAPGPPPAVQPTEDTLPGPFRTDPRRDPRGLQAIPGGGTGDSNNHAIALAASIGGGESVVYYFDTKAQRVLVYQYKGIVQGSKPLDSRDRGGLRLLAARHMDYDLKLEGYRDLSERTRGQLEEAFEDAFSGKKRRNNPFPTKKVGGVNK
ncbi:MAG: hypothetical protein QNJ90_11420 [Planctomycetota bacterium]|nr:hypothetical protein [Planctomycetota bacterium]